MATPNPAGEVVGLDQSIAYAEQVAQLAGEHAPAGNEGYLAHLVAAHVGGAGLVTARQMQDAFAAVQAAAAQHANDLTRQKAVQQQYDANPDAGDKDYHQAGAGAAAQPAETPTEPKGAPVTSATPADIDPADEPYVDPIEARRRAGDEEIRQTMERAAAGKAVDKEVLERGYARDGERDVKRHDEPTPDERADQQRIIDAATRLAERPGNPVHLANLRAALPDMPAERFDDAVDDLHHRPDVSIFPDTGPDYHDLDRRRQGVAIGGSNETALWVRSSDVSVDGVVAVVRAADRRRAATCLDGVPDHMLDAVADRIGAPLGDTPAQTRAHIVDTSVANNERQRAAWRQQEQDGTLLGRADRDPDWVASWTPAERAAARAAAERQAAGDWAPGAERGRRWLDTIDS